MGWTWFLATAHFGDAWRVGRRIVDHGLKPSAAAQYRALQRNKTHDFLKHVIAQPKGFVEHIEQCVLEVNSESLGQLTIVQSARVDHHGYALRVRCPG